MINLKNYNNLKHDRAKKELILELTFSSIFADTRNFVRNNLFIILIILLIVSIISQIFTFLLQPSMESIAPINALMEKTLQTYGELTPEAFSNMLMNLSEHERNQVVPVIMSYLVKFCLILFITNIVAMSVITSTIFNLSYKQLTLSNLVQCALRNILQIVLFMLSSIPLFLALFILAGIIPAIAMILVIAASLFYMLIYILFLGIIVEPNATSFIEKLKTALKLFRFASTIILPIMLLFLLATIALSWLFGSLGDHVIIAIIANTVSLLISFTVICYCYRLFSLMRQRMN